MGHSTGYNSRNWCRFKWECIQRWWFSVMKQSLACERFEWIIVPLHWDAVLGGFHVWSLSEQHDTLHHPNGEFFWKFLLYMSLFLHFFLKSFGHGFGHNCNKVLGVNFQCPCNIFFFFVCFVLLLLLILHSLAYFSAPQLTGLSESVFLTWLILENPQEPRAFFFFFQKNTLEPPLSRFSLLSWVVYCFLTVLQFVAQNVFNASQGVRDIGFLSWTPLTIFPPQVSCVKEGT